jgi:3-hydroxyisobutyrate dehydrogenase-like beta-hydroxyacid dehydrogenase
LTLACGIVGAGAIGRGFVATLARAGFSVTVYDVDGAATAAATELGAAAAPSLEALAGSSDVVLLALPDTPQIEGALADGLEAGLRPGSVVVVTSTVSPDTPVALERRLASLGVDVLDAPVSGGPAKAAAGELAMMVGGRDDVFERCRAVLEALSGHLVHVGPTGHGEIAKLVNNLMGAVIVAGIAEGLTLAAKLGADVRTVCDSIAGGSGSSWILREWIPETVFRGDYARRFSLDLMRKDMGLIADLAGSAGVRTPALDVAAEAFEQASRLGYGGFDFTIVAALSAREAGAELPGGAAPPAVAGADMQHRE